MGRDRGVVRTIGLVLLWVALATLGVVGGGALAAGNGRLHVDAAPFHARWELALEPTVLLPLALAVVVVAVGPLAARRLTWRQLLLATTVASFGWAATLATVGSPGFVKPMTWNTQYLAGVPLVDGDFLRTFAEALPGYPTHVKSHPPGLVLVLWAFDAVGLGGPRWGALLVVGVGATAAAAVLVALREVVGERRARRAAPFLVLVPGAVWMGTSGDAFFTGVGAWAVAVTVLATSRRWWWSAAAGALWFAALMLSYGLVLLAGPAVAVAMARRRFDVLVTTGLVTVAVLALLGAISGFWWPEGMAATRRAYWAGWAAGRSWWVFIWLNLCAFAFAAGPAAGTALRHLRRAGPAALLAGGALAGILLADLSLLSKGEVERIWLPWVPWLLAATVVLRGRRILALQAATGIGLQLAVRATW